MASSPSGLLHSPELLCNSTNPGTGISVFQSGKSLLETLAGLLKEGKGSFPSRDSGKPSAKRLLWTSSMIYTSRLSNETLSLAFHLSSPFHLEAKTTVLGEDSEEIRRRKSLTVPPPWSPLTPLRCDESHDEQNPFPS